MQRINEDIKSGNLKHLYLLYGEESYLRRQFLDKLISAILPEKDSPNVSVFEAKDAKPIEIMDMAMTMPFFSDRRLIVLKDTGFFKSAGDKDRQRLTEFLSKELPDYLYVLFSEDEIDKRGKIYKGVSKTGTAVDFARQDEKTLGKWIRSRARQNKIEISERVCDRLILVVGNDMSTIACECEKLFAYVGEGTTINEEDITAVCTPTLQNRIFEMLEAATDGNRSKALSYYEDLLSLREAPVKILSMLGREYRLLLETKAMAQEGYGQQEIASKLKIHPFAAGKYRLRQRNLSFEYLKESLNEVAEADEAIKTGMIDEKLAVELLLLRP
ncbi:MAG: DNA polymerase III subunit delta [Lachnospiraceae bacterium]|jgi:DNA polymerase-3 subunit delta|nr:DNA polymerase III subunit delta [Lachnospiraceae bacterium]